jgi:hypothetical protein
MAAAAAAAPVLVVRLLLLVPLDALSPHLALRGLDHHMA